MEENTEILRFVEQIRLLQTTDKGHPDTFNPLYQVLIGNDLYLRQQINILEETLREMGLELDDITTVDLAALADHIANKQNPHGVTAGQLGLGSLQNYGIATTGEAQAGTVNNKYMTPLRVAEAIRQMAPAKTDFSGHTNNKNNPHAVTKTQVGLGNVADYTTVHSVTDPSTTKNGTAGAVKIAYDKAIEAYNLSLQKKLIPSNNWKLLSDVQAGTRVDQPIFLGQIVIPTFIKRVRVSCSSPVLSAATNSAVVAGVYLVPSNLPSPLPPVGAATNLYGRNTERYAVPLAIFNKEGISGSTAYLNFNTTVDTDLGGSWSVGNSGYSCPNNVVVPNVYNVIMGAGGNSFTPNGAITVRIGWDEVAL